MRGLLYFIFLASSTTTHGFYSVCAAPRKSSGYTVKEEVNPPRGWTEHSRPSPDHKVTLRIALSQPNFSELERHLYEVSDPGHHRYGQHLSKAEVDALVAPHPESINSVDEWLASFGVEENEISRSSAQDWVTLTIPVSLAEEMLDTKYQVWQHSQSGDRLVRTTTYSLPSHLHDHIDAIQPTTMFGRFKKHMSTVSFPDPSKFVVVESTGNTVKTAEGLDVDASCKNTITISCLQQLYNGTGYNASATLPNSIAVTGYLEQFVNNQDLQSFYADQRPDALNSTFKFISANGGLNNQTLFAAGDEASLDLEFASGLAYPIPATFYSTAGRGPYLPEDGVPINSNEPFAEWLDFALTQDNPPLVISTSYGEDEQTVPKSYAVRVCQDFAQLGARGVSLLFSSGDAGVGDGVDDPQWQQCYTNDGNLTTKFLPGFPASCPYVTAVGGTTGINETAVTRFASGGGFSDYFDRPEYQDNAVFGYYALLPNLTTEYSGLMNPDGRAYPDVSAQADMFKFFFRGRAGLIGGTSAAAPTFGAFVALLNDALLKAGMAPLGFLNPFIYTKGAGGLNDIRFGHNSGCGTHGFDSTPGWDPVTGWGTPNLGRLLQIVLEQ